MSERQGATITIDGPSGVGKSTISKRVAATLGYTYLDTGAMYRAVAFYFKEKRLDFSDDALVAIELKNIDLTLIPAADEAADVGVLLNDQEVSGQLRTPALSMLASKISALPSVRAKLTRIQQQLGAGGAIVAEGRDTGTVVFPGARFKFFLDASPEIRAERRVLQLRARGESVDAREVLRQTIIRDTQDSERSVAPLKKAPDAEMIDTARLSIDEVCARILARVRGG